MTSQHAFGAMTLKGGICALLHARVAAAGSCRATSQQIVPAQTPTFGGTCLRAFQRAAPLPMNPWKLANRELGALLRASISGISGDSVHAHHLDGVGRADVPKMQQTVTGSLSRRVCTNMK